MNKPHVHAALIKAWADGAQIQIDLGTEGWSDVDDPCWFAKTNYRIKPQPKSPGELLLSCYQPGQNWQNVPQYAQEVWESKARLFLEKYKAETAGE